MISWAMVMVHKRDYPGILQNTNIMHAKNHTGRKGLTQKPQFSKTLLNT